MIKTHRALTVRNSVVGLVTAALFMGAAALHASTSFEEMVKTKPRKIQVTPSRSPESEQIRLLRRDLEAAESARIIREKRRAREETRSESRSDSLLNDFLRKQR